VSFRKRPRMAITALGENPHLPTRWGAHRNRAHQPLIAGEQRPRGERPGSCPLYDEIDPSPLEFRPSGARPASPDIFLSPPATSTTHRRESGGLGANALGVSSVVWEPVERFLPSPSGLRRATRARTVRVQDRLNRSALYSST